MSVLWLVVSLAAGLAAGVFFFGGLWWTVRRAPDVRNPAIWVLASFLIRTAVVLSVFFLVSAGQWERIAALLVGFLAARTLAIRHIERARDA